MHKTPLARQAAAVFALALSATAAHALPQRAAATAAEALAALQNNAGTTLTPAQRAVDAYSALNAPAGTVLFSDGAAGTPKERALNFLSLYGALQGVTDSVSQFAVNRIYQDDYGSTHVHLDQMQGGLSVFGARLVVHMNNAGITGVNGVFIPGFESLSVSPKQDLAYLQQRAIVAATKLHPGKASGLSVESARLMFYNTGILQSLPGSNRLAYEVMVSNGPSNGIRERIILDANEGFVLNRINEIHSLLNRKIYTPVLVNPATNTESTPVFTEKSTGAPADPAFSGDTSATTASSRTHGPGTEPLENLYLYAGGTWLLYKNLFGADGYDFTRPHSPQIQKSVYLANDQCPNAYWDGTSTNYCPGFDADDVVSHEWSHAYTEYTHGLVYQYQSGALNESYSDIFGETYDLIDGFEGPLGATLTEGAYLKTGGSRWVVGEDLSETAAETLLRDMWDPDDLAVTAPATGRKIVSYAPSPGSTNTSANYECGTTDSGGVHTNSGVSNHAFAMLVDGRPNAKDATTFNNVKIPGIGLNRAVAIYFRAESVYQTPTTNYPQHADALAQSCKDLIGKPIKDVFGKTATETISQATCDAVDAAAQAVEFRKSVTVKCNYLPVLKAESTTPALCASGKYVTSKFYEGFGAAAVPTGWTQGKNLKGDLDIAGWTTNDSLPAPHSGRSLFFKNDKGGSCATGGDQSASHYIDTPAITVTGAADFFTFTHFMQSEAGYDGGNLKYSLNNAAFAIVPTAAFTYNGHSGKLSNAMTATTPTGNNTNPNAAQAAWTGSDQGEATGSWGTTVIDLSKLTTAAKAGDMVKFRFDFSNDGCGGNLGWFVDDVNEFICAATPPPNTIPVASLKTDKTTGDAPLTVKISAGGSDADVGNGDKVVSYALSYGDGSASTAESYAAGSSTTDRTHTFSAAGVYTLTLSVKDSTGADSTPVTQKITVTGKADTTPTNPTVPVVTTPVVTKPGAVTVPDGGRFGGGSMGVLALLPLFGAARRRRRRQ